MTTLTIQTDISYCQKEGHLLNPLNIVCLNCHCNHKGIICSHCLLEDHDNHVKQCVTLQQLQQSLKDSDTKEIREEFGSKGSEILKKHQEIVNGFKLATQQLRNSIDSIESGIEQQIKKLSDEADIYFEDSYVNLLKSIRSPKLNIAQLNKDIIKFIPLIEVNKLGKVESFKAPQIQKEVSRIMQSALLLEREVNYWMWKCSEDLQSLKNKVMEVTYEKPVSVFSENRFGMTLDSWTMEGVNAISFQLSQNLKSKDVWLIGLGMYEISIPESQDLPNISVTLNEGEIAGNKGLVEEQINISELQTNSQKKMNSIVLQTAIKLSQRIKYTLSISCNKKIQSYAGMNGTTITSSFEYFDSQFAAPSQNNGTSALAGLIPYLIYEIR